MRGLRVAGCVGALALALAGVVGCGSSRPSGPVPVAVSGAQLTGAVAAVGGSITGLTVTGGVAVGRLAVPVLASGTAGTEADGWISWPVSTPLSGLVLYAHGCCGVPSGWESDVVRIEKLTATMVVAMDYRDADAYAPDIAAADLAAADQLVRLAAPGLSRTVAWGQSEGGAATGLLIAGHPGLVDGWVDQSGAVDFAAVITQLQQDLTAGLTGVQDFATLAAAAAGSPPDPARIAALSPASRPTLLRTLHRAVLVHGSGDLIVPAAQSVSLAGALRGLGVPVQLRLVEPAPGQPVSSIGWHTAPSVEAQAVLAVRALLAGRLPSGGDVVRTSGTLG